MQITFDSAQPLDEVLRVVGAMYGVSLSVDGGASSARSSSPKAAGRRRGASRRSAGSRNRVARSSTADIRAWAVANGYEVSSKGRISRVVLDAFSASQG